METVTGNTEKTYHKKTREEKLKDQKLRTEIVKSLNGYSEPDQKFQALLKRCVEVELKQKHNQSRIETLLMEKENLVKENQRMLLTKAKLESLCRELQYQNKYIKASSNYILINFSFSSFPFCPTQRT